MGLQPQEQVALVPAVHPYLTVQVVQLDFYPVVLVARYVLDLCAGADLEASVLIATMVNTIMELVTIARYATDLCAGALETRALLAWVATTMGLVMTARCASVDLCAAAALEMSVLRAPQITTTKRPVVMIARHAVDLCAAEALETRVLCANQVTTVLTIFARLTLAPHTPSSGRRYPTGSARISLTGRTTLLKTPRQLAKQRHFVGEYIKVLARVNLSTLCAR
jgi:hypothetical protein